VLLVNVMTLILNQFSEEYVNDILQVIRHVYYILLFEFIFQYYENNYQVEFLINLYFFIFNRF